CGVRLLRFARAPPCLGGLGYMSTPQPLSAGAQELLAHARRSARRNALRAKRLVKDPRGTVNNYRDRRAPRPGQPVSANRLTPAEALRENGFTVFRRLIPAQECSWIASTLKHEAGIEELVKYT